MAELAERLPEGAEEVVLGRRVSAGGRTSAFVAGRAATAADLKLLGGRLLAFYGQHEHRKLTIASAQMEVLDGFAGAEHLELRERYREAHRECVRLAAELAELRERDGSRERDLDLYRYELSEIEEVAPDPPRSGPSWRPSASACATPRACARRRPGAHAGLAGADEDGGGAAGGAGPGRSAAAGRRPASTPTSTRSPSGSAPLAVELGDVAARAARLRRGHRGRPGRAGRRSRSGWRRSTGCERKHGGSVESVLAHAERCRAEIARLEGAEERGAEAEAALAEAEARRAELGEQARATGRAKAAGAAARSGSPRSWSGWRWPGATLEVVLEPHPDGFGAERRARRSSCGSRRTRASSRRRCATPPPAASSRG